MNLAVFLEVLEVLLKKMNISNLWLNQIIIKEISLKRVRFILDTQTELGFLEWIFYLEKKQLKDKLKDSIIKETSYEILKEKLLNREKVEIKDLFNLKQTEKRNK